MGTKQFVFGAPQFECRTLALQPTLSMRPEEAIDSQVQKALDGGWDLKGCIYDSETRMAHYTFVRRRGND